MTAEELFIRRTLVAASGIIYWTGVLINAWRVQRHIGRSPNLKPAGSKERLLWFGWLLVSAVWIAQPFLIRSSGTFSWLRMIPGLGSPFLLYSGIVFIVAGYGATLRCYAAMGDSWRIGINQREKNALVTTGPYRRVRHPIYLFQSMMLVGVAFLLPTPLSLLIVGVHLCCVLVKAADEEEYLRTVHGNRYDAYRSETGRLFPRFRNAVRREAQGPAARQGQRATRNFRK